MQPALTPVSNSGKLKFNIKTKSEKEYNLNIVNKEENITFTLEDLIDFPVKIFELKTSFKELKELDENFFVFRNAEKLMNGIKTCIESKKYLLEYNEEENCVIFGIENDFFENGVANIKIPEKEQDLKTQVDSLIRVVSELKEEIKKYKNDEKSKEEAAINSFNGSSFLTNDEKILISKWVHPNKIIKFNMLFNTSKDGDSSSTFHYYCDGVFPTVTVILDTSGRRFGGYSTQNWCQSTVGGSYTRAPGSFIFNLSNKKKFDLISQVDGNSQNAVYRHNSYGPTFGGAHDLCLYSSCRSNNNSYVNKSSSSAYNTENNNNLFGSSGTTNFQVSYYEVYQVVFE